MDHNEFANRMSDFFFGVAFTFVVMQLFNLFKAFRDNWRDSLECDALLKQIEANRNREQDDYLRRISDQLPKN